MTTLIQWLARATGNSGGDGILARDLERARLEKSRKARIVNQRVDTKKPDTTPVNFEPDTGTQRR